MSTELNQWASLVKNRIRNRLDQMSKFFKGSSVLEKREVKQELDQLKSQYIITVVDKAANNFAIQCHKLYFLKGATELGLSNLQGNSTYTVVNDKDGIISTIERQMNEKFGVQTVVQVFPTIFWTPKFHKNPIKFRPIAGSKNKLLSPLEKVTGKMLKKISSHFQNYCNTAERLLIRSISRIFIQIFDMKKS